MRVPALVNELAEVKPQTKQIKARGRDDGGSRCLLGRLIRTSREMGGREGRWVGEEMGMGAKQWGQRLERLDLLATVVSDGKERGVRAGE